MKATDSRRLVYLFLIVCLVMIQTGTVLASQNHEHFFNGGYEGAKTCLVCHDKMAGEVMDSVQRRYGGSGS